MTTVEKRIQMLEAALGQVSQLLQRTDLTELERGNLINEGNLITEKLEELRSPA